MDRLLFGLPFLPKMVKGNINCTSGLQLSVLSTPLLEGCQHFMLYLLTLLEVLIVLYYPLFIYFLYFYLVSALYNICRKLCNLPDDINSKRWKKLRKLEALVSDLIGKILHGYQVCGIENLPEGPALLIYYHGALPLDAPLLTARLYLLTGRTCYHVIDHVFFKIPGLIRYFQFNNCIHHTREECVQRLKKGNLLMISPGGFREQNYGDHTYKLVWGNRKGFAQVAIDAKVPIIPVFTQNLREGYRSYGRLRIMKWIYETTRIFPFPMCGLFPVKLWTHIGPPIPFDPNLNADELFKKTKKALEDLRDKHQKIPGSIWRALWERFEVHHKDE